ncbi:MAG: hypothetical protein AAF990_06630 [Bacteroidota bacterium]
MPARMDYRTCEPFRAWNRVEPRVRKEEFSRALRCEIHDPLWMLTRQWQFGEFKGEDTGSAIFAKTLLKASKLTRFKAGKQTAQNYTDDVPLETLVESEVQQWDFRKAMQAGKRWLKILERHGNTYNDSRGTRPIFILSAYENSLIDRFPFELPAEPTPDAVTNDHPVDIQKSKLLTNHKLRQMVSSLQGRAIDGIALYKAIQNNSAVASSWRLAAAHEFLLLQAANEYKGWIESKFAGPTSRNTAWNPSQLEYQFACAAPKHEGGHSVLTSDEYFHGQLDWYAFDVDPNPAHSSGLLNTRPSERAAALKKTVQTFIPAPAAFAGMPNARWWEFEDGNVDLGNISADTTDLAKVVLSEFALIYGNDWFVLPYPLEVGSICEVGGIVVTDVFGQKTLVEPARQGQSDDWETWGLFNLSPRKSGNNLSSSVPDTRLFLPPAIAKAQESEPIEEVLFIRDEMANMVWGIETKVPDLLSRSLDGHIAANELNKLWLELQGIDPDAEPIIAEEAIYKYTLGNTVPENWIPFVVVHKKDGQNRAVRLQRASMPRLYFQDFQAVRPRTAILRYGMADDPGREIQAFVNPSHEEQDHPYYVNEEEVPRAGACLRSTFQRTRWYDGRIFNWYGRRKTIGRGEGASGLAFDILEMARKNKK